MWYNVHKADIIPDGWPRAEDGGVANYTIGLRLWYNVRKADIIPNGMAPRAERGVANYTMCIAYGIITAKRTLYLTDGPTPRTAGMPIIP